MPWDDSKLRKGTKMEKKSGTAGNGIGIFTVLAVVFIVLKLIGVIDWSWWWVLCPVWGPLALLVVGFFVYCVCVATYKYFNEKK